MHERRRGGMRSAYPVTVRDRREALHESAGQAAGCPGLRLAHLRVFRPGSPDLHALKTTINSRNMLLVSYYLCAVGSRHRGSAAGGGQPPRGHRKGAGHGPHRPDYHRRRAHGAHGAHGARDAGHPVGAAGANASRRPGPGSARIPRRDIVSTLTSRDAGATGNRGRALAVPRDHQAPLSGSPTQTSSTPGTPAAGMAMPAAAARPRASGATSRKPPDCPTRIRADRPDPHAQPAHSP